jgi:hypothetical protein
MATLDKSSVEMAVEITKAAIPMQQGTWIDAPDTVAAFIEKVARKIESLLYQEYPQQP